MKDRAHWLAQIAAYADGLLSREEIDALDAQLRRDPTLRREFIEYLNLDAALIDDAAGEETEAAHEEKIIPVPASVWRRTRWIAAAALFLLTCLGSWWALQRPAPPGVTVEVLAANGVRMQSPRRSLTTGARWKLSRLRLTHGTLTVRLESGARLDFAGTVDAEFAGPMKLRVYRGKVTADVGDNAKGFTIETAQARVVDLGTKFGVDVTESAHTDVVVFQGEVELFEHKAASQPVELLSRLVEGEAVRIDAQQQLSRIVNVTSGPHDEGWSSGGPEQAQSVIASVRDNLRDPQAKFFYRIVPGGLQEDVRAFVGQRHEWNGLNAGGIPPWLLGADLVQTFMKDRLKSSLEITVTVARPAVVYVFFDDRKERPAWLPQNFTDTGARIGLEYAPAPSSGRSIAKGPGVGMLARLSVWKCELPEAGSITLGPPHQPNESANSWNWMYGIAAKPLPPQ